MLGRSNATARSEVAPAELSSGHATPEPRESSIRRSGRSDRIFGGLIREIVGIVLLLFAAIVLVLIDGAWPAMRRYGTGFLISSGWDPVHLVFGALPFIVGTVVVALGAMILAGGIGSLTAICV